MHVIEFLVSWRISWRKLPKVPRTGLLDRHTVDHVVQKTFAYLEGRRFSPQGEAWKAAVREWSKLPSDPGAKFDRELVIDFERGQQRIVVVDRCQQWIQVPNQKAHPGSAANLRRVLSHNTPRTGLIPVGLIVAEGLADHRGLLLHRLDTWR